MVISHDRHLLRNTVDQYFLVNHARVESFAGNLDDYYQQLLRAPVRAQKPVAASSAVQDKKSLRRESAQQRSQLAPLKKRVRELEGALDRLQQRLSDIEEQLQAADLYDAERKNELQQLLRDQGAAQKQVDELEAQWLLAQEELEEKQSGLSA